ncbi:MAG: hypothetical protein B7X99_04580, partial [Rhizobiales bacterium 17-65-6]
MSLAAGVAFYGLLAVFPAISALISLYGLVLDPTGLQQQLDAASWFLPSGAIEVMRDQALRIISKGAPTLGFSFLLSLGIALWSANAATKAFFALPEEVKRRYVVPGGGGQRGLTPFGVEAAKGHAKADLKEFWHVGRELPPGHAYADVMPANLWPSEIPDFHEAVWALFDALDKTGATLLRAIAVHLGLDTEFFADPVRDGNSILRLLHYPPVPPE